MTKIYCSYTGNLQCKNYKSDWFCQFVHFILFKIKNNFISFPFFVLELLFLLTYSHLSNNRGGWNKRGGGAKVAKSIKVEVGINVEGGIFWKKLVYKCNKRGVEGGKNLRNQ